jgi:hypothetical protein
MSPKFSARWFEVDPTYPIILGLQKLGIVRDLSPQRARELPKAAVQPEVVAQSLVAQPLVEEPRCVPSPR